MSTTPLQLLKDSLHKKCPICSAQPGDPCITITGNVAWVHASRRKTSSLKRKSRSLLRHCKRCGAAPGEMCIATRGPAIGTSTWSHLIRRQDAGVAKRKNHVDDKILTITCPLCGSGTGIKCITSRGEMTNFHVDRRRAWRAHRKTRNT